MGVVFEVDSNLACLSLTGPGSGGRDMEGFSGAGFSGLLALFFNPRAGFSGALVGVGLEL